MSSPRGSGTDRESTPRILTPQEHAEKASLAAAKYHLNVTSSQAIAGVLSTGGAALSTAAADALALEALKRLQVSVGNGYEQLRHQHPAAAARGGRGGRGTTAPRSAPLRSPPPHPSHPPPPPPTVDARAAHDDVANMETGNVSGNKHEREPSGAADGAFGDA